MTLGSLKIVIAVVDPFVPRSYGTDSALNKLHRPACERKRRAVI